MTKFVLPYNWHLIRLEEVDSTNNYAIELAQKETQEGCVVVAKTQNKGKGRYQRTWQSPEGNLYCSIILKPEKDIKKLGQTSFVSAVAVIETIAEIAPNLQIECKWPNDILVKGHKVAGILIETVAKEKIDFVILGIGINLSDFPKNLESGYQATSLANENITCNVDDFLFPLLKNLYKWLKIWREQGFLPIKEKWLKNAFGIDKEITIRMPNSSVKGIFKGIDDEGSLILLDENHETKKIISGEVFFNL